MRDELKLILNEQLNNNLIKCFNLLNDFEAMITLLNERQLVIQLNDLGYHVKV